MPKSNDRGVVVLQERLLELELALEKGQWIEYGSQTLQQEFSRTGLATIMHLARLNYIKNPLIKRGVDISRFYVFGRGVNISAKDTEINKVIQAFIDDNNNQAELTSPQARKERDKELRIDGNLFFALFVQPETGFVRIGIIPPDEIDSIIRDKDNRKKPLYYKRLWVACETDYTTGKQRQQQVTTYYRDLRNYDDSLTRIGDFNIDDSCVIYHIKVGGFSDWAFGVSEVYAAIDWARAYKSFLEDFAKIIKSLARFAWRKKTGGGATGVAAARSKLNSTFGQNGTRIETNPSANAGSVMIETGDEQLDPIKTSGSTTSADQGKELRLMAGIAMGLPDHIASGDMAQGTLATAKSLDRPTEFQFTDRQELWVGIYQTLLQFVVYNAVAAPLGALRGLGDTDTNIYNEPVVTFPDGIETTIEVDFPAILEHDVLQTIQAWIAGSTFNGQTPSLIPDRKFLARQVLLEMGIDDVDELLDVWYPKGTEMVMSDEPMMQQVKEALEELHSVLIERKLS